MADGAERRAWEILKRLPWHNPKGVEVGVFRGGLSWRLLAAREDLTLHMVDAWGLNVSEAFRASGDYHAESGVSEHEDARSVATRITSFANDRRHIHHGLSADLAMQFRDQSLDFVFIDGDHSYEGCKQDIEAWWPKIRAGGWLCGHDYANDEFPFGQMVKRAVDEFANDFGLDVELGGNFTWFIRAPGQRKIERLPWDVTVACVKRGSLYGAEYVNILRAMVSKNLHKLHRFVCLTDDPTGLDDGIEVMPLTEVLPGWWAKLELFKPDRFHPGEPVLYLDLDVCVTGSLDEFVQCPGIIKDWNLPGYNSSVISWRAGALDRAWTAFTPDVMERCRGDQDWLNEVVSMPMFPAEWCVDYLDSERWPPNGSKVVCFHGPVKPHLKPYPWAELLWSKSGMGCVEFVASLTEQREKIFANARRNLRLGFDLLTETPAHDGVLAIVGGGPSLKTTLASLKLKELSGAKIWALNGALAWLNEHGIQPDAQVLADAREDNAGFIADRSSLVHRFIASTSHQAVIARCKANHTTLWTPDFDGMQAVLDELGIENKLMIAGGPTVGLKAMCIGYALGFRRFALFGFDSSYQGDDGHAYAQPLNDGDERIDVYVDGRKFASSPWMYRQAQAFQEQARLMGRLGCEIEVYGDGLLPWLARAMSHGMTPQQKGAA